MNYLFFVVILIFCNTTLSLSISIGQTFDSFVDEYVPKSDQKNFCSYYKKLMNELKNQRGVEKKAYLDSIRYIGSSSLEAKNPHLFQEIQPYLHGPNHQFQCYNEQQAKEVKRFLVRYGAFEQYNKEQLLAQAKPWNKMHSFIKNIGNKVSCWVSSIAKNPFA